MLVIAAFLAVGLAVAVAVVAWPAVPGGTVGADSPAECSNADHTDVGSGSEAGRSFTAPAGEVVDGVCIKTGNIGSDGGSPGEGNSSHSALLTANGYYDHNFNLLGGSTGACFLVSGVGTQTVTVTKVNSCPGGGVSHLDVNTSEVPEPEAPTVEKDAAGRFDRTITWALDKTVDPASHVGAPGDSFESDWTVTATKTVVDGNFVVTGNITVNNPNAFPINVSIADVLNDGTAAAVTCPGTGNNTATVPATGQVTCSYTASPTSGSATLNTATVTVTTVGVPQPADATAAVSFTANVIGDEQTQLQDDEGPLNETLDDSDEFDYPGTFRCPVDLELYEEGIHQFDVVNTATLTGDNTDLEAEATVTVTCSFEERRTRTLIVEKSDANDIDPSEWTLSIEGDGVSESGTTSTSATVLVGETYTIDEDGDFDNNSFVQVTCDSGVTPSQVSGTEHTVTIPEGEGTITCTYLNDPDEEEPQERLIIVQKSSANGINPAQWTLSIDGDGVSESGTTSTSATVLVGETYTIDESGDFDNNSFVGVTCNSGVTPVQVVGTEHTVSIPEGEGTITCTYVNTPDDVEPQTRTLTVVKSSANGINPAQWTLSILGNGVNVSSTSSVASLVEVGLTYTISEAGDLDNNNFVSVSCNAGVTPVLVAGTQHTVTIPAGATGITCTYVNEPEPEPELGSITIIKTTNVGAENGTFPFTTTNLTPGSFSLTHGAQQGFGNLQAGQYSVAEDIPIGWTLESITCSAGSNVQVSLADGLVSVNLGEGENVTCTFHNVEESAVAPSAPFIVHKVFSDDSDAEVMVSLVCTSGTVTPSQQAVSQGAPGVFVVEDFEGELDDVDCTATENPIPDGYTSTGTCSASLEVGECTIHNEAAEVVDPETPTPTPTPKAAPTPIPPKAGTGSADANGVSGVSLVLAILGVMALSLGLAGRALARRSSVNG